MTNPLSTEVRPRPGVPLRQLALLAALWVGYSAIRRVRSADLEIAVSNARSIIDMQLVLGLPSEQSVQQLVLHMSWLVKLANLYYLAHFPVTIVFLVWAAVRHRHTFPQIRLALVLTTFAGLGIHLAYPLAPPRMLSGYVDTASLFGPNPYDMAIADSANQLAAMPSLHVGWALVVAIAVLRLENTRWRHVAVAHPLITVFVVVVTANHYWVDVIVAAVIVGAAWGTATLLRPPVRVDNSTTFGSTP